MKKLPRGLRIVVLLFFVASGATGLVLEIVWTRILGAVFGNTVYAASTVLTALMLGLALGSMVLGRVADRSRRPLLLYGGLELGVGVYAMLFPLLSAAACAFYAWFYRTADPGFGLLTAVRFALSLALLLPPTFLMGGTLPVLGRYLGARHDEPGQEVGYLYGANTMGAVAGCFLAGFVLLQLLGVHGSLMVAAGTALTVGAAAVLLGLRVDQSPQRTDASAEHSPESLPKGAADQGVAARRTKRRRRRGMGPGRRQPVGATGAATAAIDPTPSQPIALGTFRLVAVAFAITGFCALAYEVLWTRVLIFVLTTSTYSFATMLTTFLAGMALGSFASARFLVPRLRRPLLWFGLVEVLVGVSVLISVPLVARLERIDMRLSQYFAWADVWQGVLTRFADSFVVLLGPTILIGAAFPIVTTACLRGSQRVGRRVGQVYAANSIGCVLGSFAAGFLLLPMLGTDRSILAVVGLNLTIGVVLVWRAAEGSARLRWAVALPVAGLAAAAFALTPSDVFYATINAYQSPSKIAFLEEHATGTVAVHDVPTGERLITVSGVTVAGRSMMLRSTQKLQGYIPLCLHPNPRRVVQIGFGSGETARVGLDFGVPEYTVVEICPAVFDAGPYFEQINHGSYRDPRIRKIIMDGKNFARLSDEKFDVVMNDSIFPGCNGSSALYTIDHFRNCRERLAEGGLFSCWVPLDLRPTELRMILKSFQEVFPHTSFWVASNCLNKHGLILGTLEPLRIDLPRLGRVMSRPDVAADLKEIAIADAYDLLDCQVCDEASIRRMVADDPINSDDRPRLEFSCAIPGTSDGTLAQILAMLVRHHAPIAPGVVRFNDRDEDLAELAWRYAATGHVFRAQAAQLIGDRALRRREMNLARIEYPLETHVESCDAELRQEIDELTWAVTDRPRHRLLAQRLADKLFMAFRDEEAAHLYRQLAATEPPLSPSVLVHLAEIEADRGNVVAAEDALDRCLRIWPTAAEAHDLLAAIAIQTRRITLAQQHATAAVRLAPDDPRYQARFKQVVAARH